MLNELEQVISTGEVEGLISDPATPWKSLLINCENPVVERIYTSLGDYRVSLHKIYPCSKAMFHPHPWASAVLLLSGSYEMGIGFGSGNDEPPIACKTVLVAPSKYEMTHIDGWHYVRPLNAPTVSIMLHSNSWNRPGTKTLIAHSKLPPDKKKQLLFESLPLIELYKKRKRLVDKESSNMDGFIKGQGDWRETAKHWLEQGDLDGLMKKSKDWIEHYDAKKSLLNASKEFAIHHGASNNCDIDLERCYQKIIVDAKAVKQFIERPSTKEALVNFWLSTVLAMTKANNRELLSINYSLFFDLIVNTKTMP